MKIGWNLGVKLGSQTRESNLGVKFGSQTRESNLGVKFGIQIRESNSGVKFEIQIRESNSGVKFGSQIWESNLGVKFGSQIWESNLKNVPNSPISHYFIVLILRKKGKNKTVLVLTRPPSSLVHHGSLNWLNGWDRENIFGVDCRDIYTQKHGGEKLLRNRGRVG